MSEQGHELEFGIFPSPDADQLGRTLELAQLADVSGLDLVSIQDHPYQSRHADTWTLLSVIGARTSQVRVSPNVANLPLRNAVVLARSAATLDLLTGGRVELGLGAGAFWDGIVAAGGSRLSPAESVDALVEAIEVIRAVWGTGSVHVGGPHHRAHGLHAGPAPAHPIPIWVGAYKPRMLRVTGRYADAWIPSMGYADPDALPAMNRVIDEAAQEAGRSPRDIRRMYNITGRFGSGGGFLQGTPEDWAEQLAGLAIESSISTFVLGTDDADAVRRFAGEVAPLARSILEAHRSGPAPHEQLTGSPGGAATVRVLPTPDDGTRLVEPVWDESTRPTVARSVAPAYTMGVEQQGAAQHLVDVHDALRAELAQVRDIIEQVGRGLLEVGAARSTINTMTMRQNNWTLGAYCESYCRIVTGHHQLEDRSVFPHLRQADPAVRPVIDRLEEEHHVIAGVLEDVDRALVGLVSAGQPGGPGRDALGRLQHAVDLLTDTLLSHLSYEERELLDPLAAHGFYGR